MSCLLCFGFGYAAQHYVAACGSRFDRVIGTARNSGNAAALAGRDFGGRPVETLVFDGNACSRELAARLRKASSLLISVPPGEAGDPVLAAGAGALLRASRLESIVYLSTVGVYGDRGGAWVDETAEPRPVSVRSKARYLAETAWQTFRRDAARPVAILRLAGIYGPGRNAL